MKVSVCECVYVCVSAQEQGLEDGTYSIQILFYLLHFSVKYS